MNKPLTTTMTDLNKPAPTALPLILPCFPAAAWARPSRRAATRCRCWPASTSTSTAASAWPSSAPPAPASRPCCTCWAASIRRPAAAVTLLGKDFASLSETRARRPAQCLAGLRLPVPPPAARIFRARQRRHAADDPAHEARARPPSGAADPRRAWAWPSASCTCRANCRAASASAWRWRARWSRSRPACWPTNRPATSITPPRSRSST